LGIFTLYDPNPGVVAPVVSDKEKDYCVKNHARTSMYNPAELFELEEG
jgi:hypothetical protein